jgi:GTP pyrophosphokinase
MTYSFSDLPIFDKYSVHDRVQIERAFSFAKKAHDGQLRQSGEDYFVHPYEVARVLMQLRAIPVIVISGLLHDVLEDTEVPFEELHNDFGFHIAKIVNTVSKSRKIEILDHDSDQERKLLHHQFLDTIKDPMATLVKVADRLHNMRTLNFTKPEKQRRKSIETIKMYYPLAKEIGVSRVANEFKEIASAYLDEKDLDHALDLSKQYDREIQEKGYHKNAIDHCVMEI